MNSTRRPTATDILQSLMGMTMPQMPMQPQPQPQPQPQGAFASGGMLVDGAGSGRSDDVPASLETPADTRLSRGEYVFPADAVSAMGEGSTDAGAEVLDRLVETTRAEWQKRTAKFPDPGEGR